MPKITVELLRKRVEHNEGEIHSVEELALHQEKIEKIENLDKWCRKLRILLFQNNLISKIENVNRLKELEYLNLALNIVEKIENLEGCESLKKLDLTLNFIGELSSVKSLRKNYLLEHLYLVGNPCSDYPGYRKYVIHVLPHLKCLDGQDVTMTERLIARQEFEYVEQEIQQCEEEYVVRRGDEKSRFADCDNHDGDIDVIDTDDYWEKVTPNTPEGRVEMQMHALKLEEKSKEAKEGHKEKKLPKKSISLFFPDGRPRNMNEAKVSFTLHDEQDQNLLVLDLALPKYMDSSLLVADVQPTYAKVVIKGKIFQMVLPEEVKPDSSIAQRSKTTGHLVITMPKLIQTSDLTWKGKSAISAHEEENEMEKSGGIIDNAVAPPPQSKTEKSKHIPNKSKYPDWRTIIPEAQENNKESYLLDKNILVKDMTSENILSDLIGETVPKSKLKSGSETITMDFVDDPTVPPLM